MSTQHKPAKRRSGSGAVARRASPVALEEDEEVDEAEEQEDD